MMNKILLVILLVLSSDIDAQGTFDTWKKYFLEKRETVERAKENKDYKKIVELDEALLKTISSYPEKIRKQFDYIGAIYYEMACYQSLQNKKTQALDSFDKAFNNGWINFTLTDLDANLINIRGEKRFKTIMDKMLEKCNFRGVLKQGGSYINKVDMPLPKFRYLVSSDSNLIRVRKYFNLDSIAGNGDEISKIMNLLHWAHNVVHHDGNTPNPHSKNAIDLVETCKKENRGICCRMRALLLNECYLAMGFKSRYVHCQPKKQDIDSHVINSVYSETLHKWLWIDPTFNAYVKDDRGMLLSIAEVRKRLITGDPLVLNEDANWDNKVKYTKEYYLDYYMAKNLYSLTCVLNTGYNTETEEEGKPNPIFITLYPSSEIVNANQQVYTYNEQYFWQNPEN